MSPSENAEDGEETEIDWPAALLLLESGSIVFAGQTHSRKVRLTDETGRRYVTLEPAIDDILRAVIDLPEEQRYKIALMSE